MVRSTRRGTLITAAATAATSATPPPSPSPPPPPEVAAKNSTQNNNNKKRKNPRVIQNTTPTSTTTTNSRKRPRRKGAVHNEDEEESEGDGNQNYDSNTTTTTTNNMNTTLVDENDDDDEDEKEDDDDDGSAVSTKKSPPPPPPIQQQPRKSARIRGKSGFLELQQQHLETLPEEETKTQEVVEGEEEQQIQDLESSERAEIDTGGKLEDVENDKVKMEPSSAAVTGEEEEDKKEESAMQKKTTRSQVETIHVTSIVPIVPDNMKTIEERIDENAVSDPCNDDDEKNKDLKNQKLINDEVTYRLEEKLAVDNEEDKLTEKVSCLDNNDNNTSDQVDVDVVAQKELHSGKTTTDHDEQDLHSLLPSNELLDQNNEEEEDVERDNKPFVKSPQRRMEEQNPASNIRNFTSNDNDHDETTEMEVTTMIEVLPLDSTSLQNETTTSNTTENEDTTHKNHKDNETIDIRGIENDKKTDFICDDDDNNDNTSHSHQSLKEFDSIDKNKEDTDTKSIAIQLCESSLQPEGGNDLKEKTEKPACGANNPITMPLCDSSINDESKDVVSNTNSATKFTTRQDDNTETFKMVRSKEKVDTLDAIPIKQNSLRNNSDKFPDDVDSNKDQLVHPTSSSATTESESKSSSNPVTDTTQYNSTSAQSPLSRRRSKRDKDNEQRQQRQQQQQDQGVEEQNNYKINSVPQTLEIKEANTKNTNVVLRNTINLNIPKSVYTTETSTTPNPTKAAVIKTVIKKEEAAEKCETTQVRQKRKVKDQDIDRKRQKTEMVYSGNESSLDRGQVRDPPPKFRVRLEQVKLILFAAGRRVHPSQGYERLFHAYLNAVTRCLVGTTPTPLVKHYRSIIDTFLRTKTLRKIHNKLILGLLARCIEPVAPLSIITPDVPDEIRSRIKIVNPPDSQPARDRSSTSLLKAKKNILKQKESPYTPLMKGVQKNKLVVLPHPLRSSLQIPGSLIVDPFIRSVAKKEGITVTDKAIWLLVVAVREYVKGLLTNVINFIKQLDDGHMPVRVTSQTISSGGKKRTTIPKKTPGSTTSTKNTKNITSVPEIHITGRHMHAFISSLPTSTSMSSSSSSISNRISQSIFERSLCHAHEEVFRMTPCIDQYVEIKNILASSLLSPKRKKIIPVVLATSTDPKVVIKSSSLDKDKNNVSAAVTVASTSTSREGGLQTTTTTGSTTVPTPSSRISRESSAGTSAPRKTLAAIKPVLQKAASVRSLQQQKQQQQMPVVVDVEKLEESVVATADSNNTTTTNNEEVVVPKSSVSLTGSAGSGTAASTSTKSNQRQLGLGRGAKDFAALLARAKPTTTTTSTTTTTATTSNTLPSTSPVTTTTANNNQIVVDSHQESSSSVVVPLVSSQIVTTAVSPPPTGKESSSVQELSVQPTQQQPVVVVVSSDENVGTTAVTTTITATDGDSNNNSLLLSPSAVSAAATATATITTTTTTTTSNEPQRRGKAFGIKNLAMMMARANSTTSINNNNSNKEEEGEKEGKEGGGETTNSSAGDTALPPAPEAAEES